MNMQAKDQLAVEASRLARGAPQLWAGLIAALDVLVADAQSDLLGSASNKILVAQGRAQQIMELRDVLAHAVARVNALEEKQNKMKYQQSLRPDTRTPTAFNV